MDAKRIGVAAFVATVAEFSSPQKIFVFLGVLFLVSGVSGVVARPLICFGWSFLSLALSGYLWDRGRPQGIWIPDDVGEDYGIEEQHRRPHINWPSKVWSVFWFASFVVTLYCGAVQTGAVELFKASW